MKSFFILLFLFPLLSFAQKEDRVWVFDDSVAIDWNDTLNPVVYQIGTNQQLNENYASICERNGSLLFYIGGGATYYGSSYLLSSILNSNQSVIPNGDSIGSHRSMTQGTLFIPFPNDTNKYYLFYLSASSNPYPISPGFYYSIIDKSLNNGTGACISKVNLLVADTFTEKLTAVRHGNGNDWWIIPHKWDSKIFYKFLVTNQGISGPFMQTIGSTLKIGMGQMKFSPDGNKLGLVDQNTPFGHIDLYNFNRCTGILSNYKNLGNDAFLYGCSFSPNSKIFYASTLSKLFQFDLDSPNIALTKQLIWYDSLIGSDFEIGQHLLAPDKKIYINRNCIQSWLCSDSANMNLTVIQNPNVYGVGCNIQPYSFYLNGLRCFYGLPNMVNYNLGPLMGSPCDTILNCVTTQNNFSESLCSGDSYSFNGNQLTTAGNYFDTLVNAQGCDSLITLQLSVLNNSAFSSSQKICAGDTLHIGNIAHSNSGIFIDTLLNAAGCDSIVTTLLTIDSVIVSVSSIADTLTATASGIGINYQWINCDSNTNIIGATNQNFVATATGNYAVIVTDGNNCSKQSECVYFLVSGYGFVVSGYEFTIYPNPTDGQLTIVLRQAQHDNAEIEIIDVLGRRIERLLRTDYSSRNDIFTIDVSGLSSGVYFVKVQMSDGSFIVKKFVKE